MLNLIFDGQTVCLIYNEVIIAALESLLPQNLCRSRKNISDSRQKLEGVKKKKLTLVKGSRFRGRKVQITKKILQECNFYLFRVGFTLLPEYYIHEVLLMKLSSSF